MGIFTLVKAEIRNRKGIFFGFILLTALIVMSTMTMLGVNKNYDDAIKRAFKVEAKGDLFTFFRYGVYTDELRKRLTESELVDKVEEYPGLVGTNIKCNGKSDGNAFNVLAMLDTLPVYNEAADGFVNLKVNSESIEPLPEENRLKKGEIYLPYGLKSEFGAKSGDKISMEFLGETREFTIKGFVQEAFMGTNIMGYKTVFISPEEFTELHDTVVGRIEDESDIWAAGDVVFVFTSDKADKSMLVTLRKLNLETKVTDLAWMNVDRESSEHYSGMFIKIIMAVVTGFSVLLFIIFLIIAGHNISTEMDIDYVNLGVLKSQGVTNGMIRRMYMLEYLAAELIGILLGMGISIPVERIMSRLFFSMTGILPMNRLMIFEGLIITAVLFFATTLYILLFTGKATKVTPVKAITNGKDDFYFSNSFNAPITKRGLMLSLGFRQITSAPKRYISIMVVTTLLIFMVITSQLMSGFIRSKDALASMGEPFCEVEFAPKGSDVDFKVKDVEDIVEKYTKIRGRVYKSHTYVSVNGENTLVQIKAYPEEFSSVYRGRVNKYDNEIVITEQIAKLLDISIGDTVTIARGEISAEYMVVGIYQTMNDVGKAISMSLDGFSRLRKDTSSKYTVDMLNMYGISIEDEDAGDKIKAEVKEKYGDGVAIETYKYSDIDSSNGPNGSEFYMAADGSGILIYALTFVFALVTVVMICAKTFIQERRDIAITRALGMKVRSIRLQFALRFALIALLSGLIASLIGRCLAHRLLALVFSLFGIPHIELTYNPVAFIIPVLAFAVCYMLFGYMSARKVKKVSTRELITE